MKRIISSIILLYVLIEISVSSDTSICSDDNVTFTCQTRTSAFTWTVTPVGGGTTTCVALRSPTPSVTDPTCGPNDEFSLSISGDGSTSTLSTQSVDENLNETRIQCLDGDVDQTICIIGVASLSEFKPATISERDVGGGEECVVSVEWSEAIISCAATTPYLLSLSPSTSDCSTVSGDCQFTTDGTQYNMTLVTNQTYTVTLRAEESWNCLSGNDNMDHMSISTYGMVTSCDAHLMFSPTNGSLRAVEITWKPGLNLQAGSSLVEYTVVIEDGVGSIVRERVGAVNCSSTQCSHTYYPAVGSRAEFGVSVETAGCVTRQTVCIEIPLYCPLRDLSPSLVEENRVCGSVSGGGVCYSGDSVGSVAVYFCDDGYTLEGDTTRECLSSGLWNGSTPQCVKSECKIEYYLPSSTTIIVIGVSSILVILSIGVLLGVVGVCLTQRLRGRLSSPTSSSPPPPPPSLPPPCATYDDVFAAEETNSSQDVQMNTYGSTLKINTSQNKAYAQPDV